MKTSEQYKDIFAAMIKMRAEIAPIAKTRTANAASSKYSYKYASLDSVIELLTVVLPKYGLGWVQTIGTTPEGADTLTTRAIHESGQWIEDTLSLPNLSGAGNANQERGASITYFKRYALSALFGIATDEDTDGAAEARARKQAVRAMARTAGEAQEGREGGAEAEAPVALQATGDAAIDEELARLASSEYKGAKVFTAKTIAWLNGFIRTEAPQDVMARASMAAKKRMNAIDQTAGA